MSDETRIALPPDCGPLLEELNERIRSAHDPRIRLWYAEQAVLSGWSRNVLALQIRSRLHERQGAAPTNFAATLPAPQSDLAANVTNRRPLPPRSDVGLRGNGAVFP